MASRPPAGLLAVQGAEIEIVVDREAFRPGAHGEQSFLSGLISVCKNLAAGDLVSQDCRRLIDESLTETLRFVRAGQHFVVYVEQAQQIIVIDFLHARSGLPRRLADLEARK